MSGAIAMGNNKVTGLATPTAGTDVTHKTYVDAGDALQVLKAGDTMSGVLAMGANKITGVANPTANQDAATKNYVDTTNASNTAAATSASNAASSATASANSATASANSATASGNSATSAASSLSTFTGQYVSQSSTPSSPSTGDLWFDTGASIMKVYNGSGWVAAGSAVSGTDSSVQYIATSNQTTFNATYDSGYLQVYLNGIRLDVADYTATNGSSVVLDTGAAADDVVFIHSFGTFELADHYNKTVSDARFAPASGGVLATNALPKSGGAMTGAITTNSTFDGRNVSVDGTKLDTIPVISTASTASFIAKGTNGVTDGYIQLNCEVNSHGIKLKSPPHSAGADYTLVFPNDDGSNGQVLTSNGSGVMSWTTVDLTALSGASLTSGIIPTARINASSIANDLLDSQHYAAGSIDAEHLAADIINGSKIADNAINSEHYTDGSIDTAHFAAGSVDAAAMGANSVDSSELVDGSVDRSHLAADIVDGTKIADDAVNSEHIADGAIDLAHMSANSVDSDQYVDGSVDNAHISGMAASKLTGALPAISGANLTGVDPFPSGTVMVFHQTAAPTGWTKSTTHNDKALRVVSGNGGGSGGTHALTSPPSLAHTHTGAAHVHSIGAHSHGNNLSAAAHTLSTSQMPSHTHTQRTGAAGGTNQSASTSGYQNHPSATFATGSTGGGGSHSHGMSGSVSNSSAYNSSSAGGDATSSTTPTAFAPQYIDVIICAKD